MASAFKAPVAVSSTILKASWALYKSPVSKADLAIMISASDFILASNFLFCSIQFLPHLQDLDN